MNRRGFIISLLCLPVIPTLLRSKGPIVGAITPSELRASRMKGTYLSDEGIQSAIERRAITPNELRALRGRKPYRSGGDTPLYLCQ